MQRKRRTLRQVKERELDLAMDTKPVNNLDAHRALRSGAKRAVQEIDRIGGMEQFRKPGEHRASVRTGPLPRPSLTVPEYLRRYGPGER